MKEVELDRLLRARLERLADAVPLPEAAPASAQIRRGPVVWAASLPGRLTVAIVLVATVAIAVWAGGIGRPTGPAASPVGLVGTAQDGPFELVLRTPKATVAVNEPIEAVATLTYLGPNARVGIADAGNPILFGIEQIDGPLAGPFLILPITNTPCVHHELVADEPFEAPFRKSGGYSPEDKNADFVRAYLNDPQLRLPAGTWRIFALSTFAEGDCGGLSRSLEASVTVTVVDPATPGPTASPPRDVATDGTFELVLSASHATYSTLEPIDISAALTYRGPLASIETFHGQGAHGGPMGFGISEPVIGDLLLGPGWDQSCERTTLDAAAPLPAAFQKSGGWSGSDPRADEYRAFMSDPELRLPAGTWHIYAVADLYLGACGGEHHSLRAEITIVVGDETAIPSQAPPATRPPADVALPYPDGCAAYELSERRCGYIVEWAIDQAGLTEDDVDRVELLGDPDCVDPAGGLCNTSLGSTFLVRVRLITDAGASLEKTLRCMLGSPYPCTEDQGLMVSSVTGPNGGYWDTPCNPGPAPVGCVTPMPAIDPAAAAEAVPLQIAGLDIPIDRLGEYRIELGTATIPNGQLSEASVLSVSVEGWVVVDRFLRLTVTSKDPSRPPFENAYQHGWYPGVEDVSVALEFTILQLDPGAIISIADVVVR